MSGGSHDYAYNRVADMANCLDHLGQSPLRRAFAEHLRLVSKAMHDVEWVDSCDYSPGGDDDAIRAVLGAAAPLLELAVLIKDAEAARAALDEALKRAGEVKL